MLQIGNRVVRGLDNDFLTE